MEQSFNTLREGQCARITALHTGESLKRRLLDFGFIEGTEICCLRKGPGGSPILCRIRGTVVAVRDPDSAGIFVRLCRS